MKKQFENSAKTESSLQEDRGGLEMKEIIEEYGLSLFYVILGGSLAGGLVYLIGRLSV